MYLNLLSYKAVRHRKIYTSAGNPVKQILLKLNLPDHRKLKDGGEVCMLTCLSALTYLASVVDIAREVFRRKQFYINKHSEPSDRDAVRSHMRILSVISIKTYERYGYNYLREIVLRRADYNEYKISEKDFKSLHPNDFEDLNILHIQGKLDHLPKQDKVNLHNAVSLWTRNIVIRKRVEDLQLGIESYQTKLNLEQPNWDASDFPFKEDYTIVFKPRAVIYRDRDDNRKMMRINEVHKFSDGTLTRIKEKLDFMVKDFKLFKFNKGMENRKWTEDDKRRSEDFIEVIERRLKIRRIFRSLESFVGGRLRDIDYRLINRTETHVYTLPKCAKWYRIFTKRQKSKPNQTKPSKDLKRARKTEGPGLVNTYAARITKMIADIEDRHHGPSDAMHNPP
ncbi:hypothetical protein Tco_1316386 [Tanacetum coccineum]